MTDCCPGPQPPLAGALLKHHAKQWEETERKHWWRFDWDTDKTRCKFCGTLAPDPTLKVSASPSQEPK